ncbi:MAG: hypothetical protein E7516_06575 [Ruminococcaceae bacterium]|nr:hypothetical protein [Oscillospiraceae bacterium]MEE1138050.1 hypothetical protein [Acutalibacteraceae bacterium]
MTTKNMSLVKGMGIGIAVGSAAAMAGAKMMTKSGRRMCRRNASKAMKTVEGMLDSISMMTK